MLISKIPPQRVNFKGIFDPNVLVTGSSGYIGSHLVERLAQDGYNCVVCCRDKNKQEYLKKVVDDVNKGKADKSLCSFATFDLTDEAQLGTLMKKIKPIDAVIHLSGSTYNSESITNPRKYYDNNVFASRNLVNAMLDNDVNKILYSSTASIYTQPGIVTERQIPLPKTPYAKTKYITEQLISDYNTYGLKSTILRLFNVAGAHGEDDLLIGKNIITVLLNLAKEDRVFTLMGTDFPTPDKTCVKDFIHVDDVTNAMSKATKKLLEEQPSSQIYNLGTGVGVSLGEVVKKCNQVIGRDVKLRIAPAAQDEISHLISDSSKIMNDLNWQPTKNIEDIIRTCWKWISKNGGKL